MALQLTYLCQQGYKSAVISSTGNAAISASYYCSKHMIPLTVFVSPKISKTKKQAISNAAIVVTPKPVSQAIKYSKHTSAYLLRQSTDPQALIGYGQLAKELSIQKPSLSSVFFPVGSGATLVGTAKFLPTGTKIFAVQPSSHCPLAAIFGITPPKKSEHIVDSISAKFLPLKNAVYSAVTNSGGKLLIIDNPSILKSQEILNQQFSFSIETALAYAAYLSTPKEQLGNSPAIIATGTKR